MNREGRRRRGVMRRQGGRGETGGGSAGEPAQDAGREGGAAEIEDGAAVDAIRASIRPTAFLRADPREGESPDSADDFFTAHIHRLIDLQREVGAQAAEWAERRGPGRENHTARLAVESVRSLLLRQMGALAAREEPPSPDEIACLALALHRIEVVDKHRLKGERADGRERCSSGPAQAPFHAGNESPPRPGHQEGVPPRAPRLEAVGALAGCPRACRARCRPAGAVAGPERRAFRLGRAGSARWGRRAGRASLRRRA